MKALKHILKDAGFTKEQKQALIDNCDLMKEYLLDFKITQSLNEVEARFSK